MSGLEPASAALAAALAALWAALLALAEEAPGVVSALGDPPWGARCRSPARCGSPA
jgi:hypothetical protein